MEDGGGNARVNEQEKKGSRRVWTKEEEESLLNVLEEIVASGGRADCGQFIAGTTRKIEMKLQQLLLESGLKGSPHIDSKMKAWKRQYSVIFYMLNTSGFGWSEEKKCIEVDSDEAWESYVQNHKEAKGWRGKPFPLYERFAKIWGKDRANGRAARTPNDMAMNANEEGFCDNEFELGMGFSPLSHSQIETSHFMNPTESQTIGKKRKRSKDPVDSTFENLFGVFKDVMERSNENVAKLVQCITKEKESECQKIADQLKRMGLPFHDRIELMKKFLNEPNSAEIFKTLRSDNNKMEFIMLIVRGGFHG